MKVWVPGKFRLPQHRPYPPNTVQMFEEYFAYNYTGECDRVYLPVFWTSYYCVRNYGKDEKAVEELQGFLNNLDTSKKYFSVYQLDFGITLDVSHLDIIFFAPCGNRVDFPIPLLCTPLNYDFEFKDLTRDIFISFVGRETHFVRSILMRNLINKSGTYMSTGGHSPMTYSSILRRSVFALAPRGVGCTSFRILEAVYEGAIPVYISDEFVEPYGIDFNKYGVRIPLEDAHDTERILKEIPQEEILKKQRKLRQIKSVFTYQFCMRYINNKLNGKDRRSLPV